MREYISFRMKLGRLFLLPHRRDFGEDLLEKAYIHHKMERFTGTRRLDQNTRQLLLDSFDAYFLNSIRVSPDGGACIRMQRELEDGGKSYRPQEAKVVFRETQIGIADGPDQFLFQICLLNTWSQCTFHRSISGGCLDSYSTFRRYSP